MTSTARRTDIPRIIGHRGAVGHAPENTVAGFRKAKELGCSWVEFDCMLTRDEVVILHHDDDLDRTTNGTGLVSETNLAAVRRLDAGSWFSSDFAKVPVPTFDEAVSALAQLGLGGNVEIKPATGYDRITGRIVAERTAELWPATLPPPVMSSFSLAALEEAQKAAPQLDRAILWWEIPDDWQAHQDRLEASAVHVSVKKLTEARAAEFRNAGIPFRVYTVNDPSDAARLFDWGCEAIFTDYPDRFA
ncbi:glycerophosphodiester phosphodiesterase [Pacificispira sp.]|uniref:glycerophosphodiester phosphodiesterase n=1 Tax=Pacificispira sp. TaxID=2888761 RepID=UPI003B5302E1